MILDCINLLRTRIIWYHTKENFSILCTSKLEYLYNSYWYGGQYQDKQTAQVKLIFPSPPAWAISLPLVHTRTQGQSVYPDISLHISIKLLYLFHWRPESYTHNINAQKFVKESRNLIRTAILYAGIDPSKNRE